MTNEPSADLPTAFAAAAALAADGAVAAAIVAFEGVVARWPRVAVAHANLAVLLRRADRIQDAVAAFRAAVRLDPVDPDRHAALAGACHTAGRMEEAARSLRRFGALRPGAPEAAYNLGVMLPLLGTRADGRRWLARAVVLDPRRPGAWGRLARATARLGETERAGAQLRRALLLAPADAEAAGDQARLTDSATAYRRWAWIDPRDDEAVTGLAEILAETGDHDGAARTLSGFAKRTEVPDLALRVGRRAGAGWARARRTRYEQWRAEYDRDDSSVLADIASRWISPPTISVMLPVCDPSPLILEEAIASVERQSYAHWQLCVADDASRDPEVQKVLAAAETRDPRISVVWRPQRGHISAATNSALAGATGEWVTFLDHDDCLHIHALHHVAATIVAATIVADPTLDLIYSDEDKIDEAGSHFEPHFKPDWDPDRLLAQNYICHLAVYRRALVEAVGGCE